MWCYKFGFETGNSRFQFSVAGRRNLINFPSIALRNSQKIVEIILKRHWKFPTQNSQTLFPWNFYKHPATSRYWPRFRTFPHLSDPLNLPHKGEPTRSQLPAWHITHFHFVTIFLFDLLLLFLFLPNPLRLARRQAGLLGGLDAVNIQNGCRLNGKRTNTLLTMFLCR